MNDRDDYRPGKKALEELGIVSPLLQVGFTKEMIREACKMCNIDIPFHYSNACLASRIPYGIEISRSVLKTIEDGESFMDELGLYPVRLRYHDKIARIETSLDGMKKLLVDNLVRERIIQKLKSLGFKFITVDIEGFRSGSLNLMLDD